MVFFAINSIHNNLKMLISIIILIDYHLIYDIIIPASIDRFRIAFQN